MSSSTRIARHTKLVDPMLSRAITGWVIYLPFIFLLGLLSAARSSRISSTPCLRYSGISIWKSIVSLNPMNLSRSVSSGLTPFQEVLITSFGATENELQAIFIKMHDWERLLLARRTLAQMELLGKKGTYSDFLPLVGSNLEKEVGKVLGLTFGEKAKGTVKPLYFYVFISLLVRIALARWPDENFERMIRIMQQATQGEKEMVLKEKHTKAQKSLIVKAQKKVRFYGFYLCFVSSLPHMPSSISSEASVIPRLVKYSERWRKNDSVPAPACSSSRRQSSNGMCFHCLHIM